MKSKTKVCMITMFGIKNIEQCLKEMKQWSFLIPIKYYSGADTDTKKENRKLWELYFYGCHILALTTARKKSFCVSFISACLVPKFSKF